MAQLADDTQFIPCECGSKCEFCDPESQKQVDDTVEFFSTTPTYIRHAFVRKVFSIVLLQLLAAFGVMLICYNIKAVRAFFVQNPYLTYASSIAYIVAVLAIGCFPDFTRHSAVAITCLLFFTPLLAFMLTSYSCLFTLPEILVTMGSVVIIVGLLILFAFQTKYDFTQWFTALFFTSFNLMITSIIMWRIKSNVKSIIFSAVGSVLSCIWIIVDVQMIVGGSHKLQFTVDDCFFAALCLFTDIVTLFMDLLRFVHF